MNTQNLNKQELQNTKGGPAEKLVGPNGIAGANSPSVRSTEITNGDSAYKTSFTAGNGFSLSLLGLKSNYNEY